METCDSQNAANERYSIQDLDGAVFRVFDFTGRPLRTVWDEQGKPRNLLDRWTGQHPPQFCFEISLEPEGDSVDLCLFEAGELASGARFPSLRAIAEHLDTLGVDLSLSREKFCLHRTANAPLRPTFRLLTRPELDTALSWAAAEGWNPGLHDAHAFWAADSEGFHGMFLDDELIGTASTVCYSGGAFGFVGLFIVRPDKRHQGFGTPFWHHFIARMVERLQPNAPAALDGVFTMQPYYAKSGFTFTHRNLRMEGTGASASPHPALKLWNEIPFLQILAFDTRHFGTARPDFLRYWLTPPGSRSLVYVEQNQLLGLGTIRPCGRGFKIGPLFAETPEIAEALFTALSAHAPGQPITLDIPECNPAAVSLAQRHAMTEVFGCARMVRGPIPAILWPSIYGVTTFELG